MLWLISNSYYLYTLIIKTNSVRIKKRWNHGEFVYDKKKTEIFVKCLFNRKLMYTYIQLKQK